MVIEEVSRLTEVPGLDSDYRHLELGQLQPQHLVLGSLETLVTS